MQDIDLLLCVLIEVLDRWFCTTLGSLDPDDS
jgi:hypothetical protein